MLIPSSLDPDIVFTEHLGRIDVVLAGPVVERHMVQLAALAHRVAQAGNLMSEHVGAHPGADFRRLPSTPRSRVSNPRWRSKALYSATDFPASAQTLVPSGAKARAHANSAAIELLGRLRAAGLPATPAEQRVLAAWSGWGAVPEAFDCRDDRVHRRA